MHIDKINKIIDFWNKLIAEIKKNKFLYFTVIAILKYRPIWETTLTNPEIRKDRIFLGKKVFKIQKRHHW